MSSYDKWCPTDAQRAVLRAARMRARVLAESLIGQARESWDAIVDLPHVNERGESVKHGVNHMVLGVMRVQLDGFQSLWTLCGRDWLDLTRFERRFANNRFWSETEWEARFSHLEVEIERLRERVAAEKTGEVWE